MKRNSTTLFLTSKVRLHCDEPIEWREEKLDDAFPDLKGQAPLRRLARLDVVDELPVLFLTSKVRLHCDLRDLAAAEVEALRLFLTSKVRLHCDSVMPSSRMGVPPLFLTSKVRLHCDCQMMWRMCICSACLFLTSKVRLHCDQSYRTTRQRRRPHLFPTSKVRFYILPHVIHTQILEGSIMNPSCRS